RRSSDLDVELRFVGREGKPVRSIDVAGRDRGAAAGRIETIDVGWQFGRGHVALVIAENAERRIGEPDRVIGFDDDVVGRIERLAVELVDQGGNGAVELCARQAPGVVLTGYEQTLTPPVSSCQRIMRLLGISLQSR